MRNCEGTVSALTFRPIQPRAARTYSATVANLVFFASKCAWGTITPDLTSAKTTLQSLLFEPRVGIAQTYMLRYVQHERI